MVSCTLTTNDLLFLLFWAFFLDGYTILAIIVGIFLLQKFKKINKKRRKLLYKRTKH